MKEAFTQIVFKHAQNAVDAWSKETGIDVGVNFEKVALNETVVFLTAQFTMLQNHFDTEYEVGRWASDFEDIHILSGSTFQHTTDRLNDFLRNCECPQLSLN